MSKDPQPRAAFTVRVTEQDYVAAAKAAARFAKTPAFLLSVVFAAAAGISVAVALKIGGRLLMWKIALLSVCAAVLAGGAIFAINAYRTSKSIHQNYRTYRTLFSTALVTLREDAITVAGAHFSRCDPYALLTRLIETRRLFVLLREDGSFAVLPKHDLPLDGGRVPDFLRTTFARKYTKRR